MSNQWSMISKCDKIDVRDIAKSPELNGHQKVTFQQKSGETAFCDVAKFPGKGVQQSILLYPFQK